jgi:hypothetical protein
MKHLYLRLFFIALALACAALLFFPSIKSSASFRPMKSNPGPATRSDGAPVRKAVLVELFTSEGCSSCPPADELLGRLRHDPSFKGVEVIPLGFHVDYWNSLGWKDRFSSADFSRRQELYARTLRLDGPYTPQMVVDGTKEFVGSSAGEAQSAITRAAGLPAPAEITISLPQRDQMAVQVKAPASANGAGVILAVTEDNLATKVDAGENGGRELHHAAVVRELRRLGAVRNGTFAAGVPLRLEKDWKPADLRAVVFVQEGDEGRVLGAASVALSNQPR